MTFILQVQCHTVVCSLHFPEEMTEISGYSKKRYLKEGAVPLIFECWRGKTHIYKQHKVRPPNRLQQKKISSDDADTENDILATENELNEPVDDNLQINNAVIKNECQTLKTDSHDFLVEQVKLLENKVASLKRREERLLDMNQALTEDLKSSLFCIENLKPFEFQFYTGFQSRKVFDIVLNILNPGPNCENIVMVNDKNEESDGGKKRSRSQKLSPENQFFLFLCRLKLGLFEMDLAKRFNISIGTVSNIIVTWANFCYVRLGLINIWPTRDVVDSTMPNSFKEKYPSTRVIIDCTEIKVNMPSSMLLKSQTYSNYKSTNTLKGLIAIAPCGSVTFVSELYHGSISDREITIRSGLLNLPFDKGDSIMADKGFDIQDLFDEKCVKLNIPPFLGQYGQMSNSEVYQTQSIAAERIHVERAINKIKNFHIFDQPIPVTLFGSINQIWSVCALLTLFQDPILSCPGSEK